MDKFNVNIGVRQGGPESPILYNLYMDIVMRIFLTACKNENLRFLKLKYKIPKEASSTENLAIGNFDVNWIGYADDILVLFDDIASLKKGIHILNGTFKRFRLEVNPKKTKTMIMNQHLDNGEYPESIGQLEGKPLENVKNYRYLGCEIKYDEPTTGEAEINLRTDAADTKFYSLAKNMMNMKIDIKIRAIMLNSLVRSRLAYSCEAWHLTQRQLEKVSATYHGYLRK